MNAKQNAAKTGLGSSKGLTILPLSCDLPVPPAPPGVSLSADERKHYRSIYKGPLGHILDDSHAYEIAVYVKLTTAMFEGASAWQAAERGKLAIQFGMTPASLRGLGYCLEGAPS